MNFIKQKCITAAVLLLVAILSITVVGKYASAPENHQKTIASLDEKKQTVMELTAAAPDSRPSAIIGVSWTKRHGWICRYGTRGMMRKKRSCCGGF